MNLGRVKEIAVNAIKIGDRARRLDNPWVEALAHNISENGLQEPIVVMKISGKWVLVAGAHRLAAVKELSPGGKIMAHIVEPQTDNPRLEARLLEIDENLFRKDLRGLDRMRSLAERKEIYLEVYPETKNGGDKGNQYTGGKKRQNEIFSFCQQTAEKIGLGRRTVELDIATWHALSTDSQQQLAGSKFAEKSSDIRAIAALGHEDQAKVLTLCLRVGGMDLAAAINYVTGKKTDSGVDKIYKSVTGNLDRLTPKRRGDIFENYADEIIAEFTKRGLL